MTTEQAQMKNTKSSTKLPPRNKPCPCDSGHKYKHCCWIKTMEEQRDRWKPFKQSVVETIKSDPFMGSTGNMWLAAAMIGSFHRRS